MIVLSVTSQVKYIINKDTGVFYTMSENRSIAILLLKGERDSIKLKQCSNYVDDVESQFNNLNNHIMKIDSLTKRLMTENKTLKQDNTRLNKYKIISVCSVGLNILLLTILIF